MDERHVLRQEPDPLSRSRMPKALAEHLPGAPRGLHESHRDVDRRRLACAVGTEEAKYLAAFDAEREPIERAHHRASKEPAVFLGHAVELERSFRHGSHSIEAKWKGPRSRGGRFRTNTL